jgi:uncharacterized membrane protein
MNILILIVVAVIGVALGAYFTSRESVDELVSRHTKDKENSL